MCYQLTLSPIESTARTVAFFALVAIFTVGYATLEKPF